MTLIGYHASHEQFAPSELLTYVSEAQAAGFDAAKSSDHFHPWTPQQGESGFAWSWLGAAMQATSLPFGIISAPGYRYHPAVLAQAAATIAEMFPRRLWLALGSGEAINETMTGLAWPEKAERNARLRECADVIRALFAGETVTHRGRVTLIEAKLYSRPVEPVQIYGAALSEATARFVGEWADGLLTTGGTDADAVQRIIEAFRETAGTGKPVIIQSALSWAEDDETAFVHAREQWSACVAGAATTEELRRPADFEALAAALSPDMVRERLPISSSMSFHVDWISRLLELGPAELHLHQVGRNQGRFIRAFGEEVLPQLIGRGTRAALAG